MEQALHVILKHFDQPPTSVRRRNSFLTSEMKATKLAHSLFKGLACKVRPAAQCRQFRTSTPFANTDVIRAAPPIEEYAPEKPEEEPLVFARPIPRSPSYFTGYSNFTDDLVSLQELQRKCAGFPRLHADSVTDRVIWKKLGEYRQVIGDNRVGPSKYQKIVRILNDLSLIHPKLMPTYVKKVIEWYRRSINPNVNKAKPIVVDKFGRALGTGRRKTSIARAWVVEGDGQVLINGKTLAEAFGRVHDRESAIWPLKVTDRLFRYNVWALVEGGGTTGQAEALTLAVAKGLLAHEPLLKPALRRAGCVTRDPRSVERKKHGHLKARKMPAWVKR